MNNDTQNINNAKNSANSSLSNLVKLGLSGTHVVWSRLSHYYNHIRKLKYSERSKDSLTINAEDMEIITFPKGEIMISEY